MTGILGGDRILYVGVWQPAQNPSLKEVYDSLVAFRSTSYLWWQVAEMSFDTLARQLPVKGGRRGYVVSTPGVPPTGADLSRRPVRQPWAQLGTARPFLEHG
jgi:hypothetical protein